MAINPAALPATPDSPTASVTSRETGSHLDLIRHAIQACRLYAERAHDDQELAAVHKCVVALQSIVADHAKNRDQAIGITPTMKHVPRVAGSRTRWGRGAPPRGRDSGSSRIRVPPGS
jgi:hypothetical protein